VVVLAGAVVLVGVGAGRRNWIARGLVGWNL
jgi:hypothetical protein